MWRQAGGKGKKKSGANQTSSGLELKCWECGGQHKREKLGQHGGVCLCGKVIIAAKKLGTTGGGGGGFAGKPLQAAVDAAVAKALKQEASRPSPPAAKGGGADASAEISKEIHLIAQRADLLERQEGLGDSDRTLIAQLKAKADELRRNRDAAKPLATQLAAVERRLKGDRQLLVDNTTALAKAEEEVKERQDQILNLNKAITEGESERDHLLAKERAGGFPAKDGKGFTWADVCRLVTDSLLAHIRPLPQAEEAMGQLAKLFDGLLACAAAAAASIPPSPPRPEGIDVEAPGGDPAQFQIALRGQGGRKRRAAVVEQQWDEDDLDALLGAAMGDELDGPGDRPAQPARLAAALGARADARKQFQKG